MKYVSYSILSILFSILGYIITATILEYGFSYPGDTAAQYAFSASKVVLGASVIYFFFIRTKIW